MKKQLMTFLLCGSLFATAQQPVDYVNPFIGTSNYGTTNPGAVCPQGMMSVVPFNVMGSEKNRFDKDSQWWSTPYSADNKFFTGFAHGSLSGVGCPELGGLLLMPTTDELKAVIEKDQKELAGEFCRGCGYCMPCPAGIEINNCARMSLLLRRSPSARYLSPEGQAKMKKIEDCLHCGHCKSMCPYGLDTPKLLEENYKDYKEVLAGKRL